MKVKSLRNTILVHFKFRRPIFEWQGVPGQFFDSLYRTLTPRFVVNAADFSTHWGASLNDMQAKYAIFGGASHVTLAADRLMVEFWNIAPGENKLALEIMQLVDKAMSSSLPETEINSISLRSSEHVEVTDGTDISSYLTKFDHPSVKAAFSSLDAIVEPSGRFITKATNQSWDCSCMIERSLMTSNGFFIQMDINLYNLPKPSTFEDRMRQAARISKACSASLDMEITNA